MSFMPQGPSMSGGLAMPPDAMGGAGLMPPPDLPPAGMGALALAPLAQQQQQMMDALKQQMAQEAMAAAMQAIAGMPNPGAAAAQTEPGPIVEPAMQGDDATGGY